MTNPAEVRRASRNASVDVVPVFGAINAPKTCGLPTGTFTVLPKTLVMILSEPAGKVWSTTTVKDCETLELAGIVTAGQVRFRLLKSNDALPKFCSCESCSTSERLSWKT